MSSTLNPPTTPTDDTVSNDTRSAATAVTRRAAIGAVALLVRFGVVQVLGVLAAVVLSKLLTPADFGAYAIVNAFVGFLSLLSAVGFAAVILQRHDDPSREQLSSLFWAQMAATVLFVSIALALSEPLVLLVGLSDSDARLIQVATLALPIACFRSIPTMILERHLRYTPLAIAETIEGALYYATAVICAARGLGVWSFIYALLVSRAGGLAILFIACPWIPALSLELSFIRASLPFGVRYQATALLSSVKDAFNPILLGVLAGATATGYIGWATSLAFVPLPIAQALWRVTFPMFARLGHDRTALEHGVGLSVRAAAATILPISMISIAVAQPATILVFDPKWLPAVPAFYLIAMSLWTGTIIGSSFFNLFSAMNRPDLSLRFTVLYMILDWGVGIPLVLAFGFFGVAVRSVIVAYGTFPLLLRAASHFVPVELRRDFLPFVVRSALGAAVSWLVMLVVPFDVLGLAISVAAGLLVYAIVSFRLVRHDVMSLLHGNP